LLEKGVGMQSRWLVFFAVLLVSAVSVQAVVQEHSTKIFAVTNDGKGLAANLDLRIEPGTGKIFSGVDALVGTSTQNAYKTALSVAEKYVPTANQYDYYFSIGSSASIVDGPSAGAATTLLMITMLQDKTIPSAVAMTGTISENGSVGTVGGVFEKAQAASEAGIKLFLIPRGEARQVTRTAQGVQSINLVEYAPKTWGLKVAEVNNLDEALQLAFTDVGAIDVNQQIAESSQVFVPEPIPFSIQVAPLQGITEKYLQRAQEQLKQAKAELNTTILTDADLVQVMFELVSESEKVLEQAQKLYDQNFLYSSANFAFTATVNAMLVTDIAQNPSILNDNSTVFQEKVDALKSDLDSLKDRLDGRVLADELDWQVAAQQRWLWAYDNVQKLENTQTIVIQTPGQDSGANTVQLERLSDLEFAEAWKMAAEDFSLELQNARQQTTNSTVFKQFADQQLVSAENNFSQVLDEERDDIQRRLDGAKTAQSLQWYLPEAADAASVTALVEAEQESRGKDLNQLEDLLNQKIRELDNKLVSEKPFVWARIYLDHARYFQQEVVHYKEQGQISQALDAAQGGISVAFLAQSAFDVHQKIYELAATAPSEPYQPQPFNPLPSSDNNGKNLSFWILLAAVIVLLVAIVILAVAYLQKKKDSGAETMVPARQWLRNSAELDKKFFRGDLNKEEYLAQRKKLAEEFSGSQESTAPLSGIDIDRLKGKVSGLEQELQELRQSFQKGTVSKQQFSVRLNSIQKQLGETRNQLENRETGASRAEPGTGSSLEKLAGEIRKEKTKKSAKPKTRK
jgi:uncharacterized protein